MAKRARKVEQLEQPQKQPEKRMKSFSAKTEHQKEYIRSIIENTITFCIGHAGTGKSFLSVGIALQHLLEGKTDSIIFTRPNVECGRSFGFLKGDLNEKYASFMWPVDDLIRYFIGQAKLNELKESGQIKYIPLEFMRGMTFNGYVVLDEAANVLYEQLKMLLTRIGENGKLIINGDHNQTDLNLKSGLMTVINKISHLDGVGVVEMTAEDICRHDIIGKIIRCLN